MSNPSGPAAGPGGPKPFRPHTPPPSTLRNPTTLITTHDPETKLSALYEARPAVWTHPVDDQTGFSLLYTCSNPPTLIDNNDITAHDAVVASNDTSLVKNAGTVIRYVDFAPGYKCGMHRTASIDFGILVEGECTMILDDGTERKMERGDVIIQRGTMHQWRNDGEGWCRMAFILLSTQGQVTVKGEELPARFMPGAEEAKLLKVNAPKKS